MTPMSPSDIEVLLHCYHSPRPHPRENAPAVVDCIYRLLEEKMIEWGDGYYMTTARGRAHVNQLCALPWPKEAWQNEHGEIIRDPWACGG